MYLGYLSDVINSASEVFNINLGKMLQIVNIYYSFEDIEDADDLASTMKEAIYEYYCDSRSEQANLFYSKC